VIKADRFSPELSGPLHRGYGSHTLFGADGVEGAEIESDFDTKLCLLLNSFFLPHHFFLRKPFSCAEFLSLMIFKHKKLFLMKNTGR
jgi:hypothetical protein